MTTALPRKFPWLFYWVALFLILTVALAPIASVVACSAIANTYGCRVDEGSAHPCMIHGKDYGETLYTMGVMGWLMLVTIPAGAVASGGWLVVLLIHRARWSRRKASGVPLAG
jgi:hypothetical protein